MNAKELIARLQKMDPETEIVTFASKEGYFPVTLIQELKVIDNWRYRADAHLGHGMMLNVEVVKRTRQTPRPALVMS